VYIEEPVDTVYFPLDLHNLDFSPFLNVTTLYFELQTAAHAITVMQHSEFPSLKEFTLYVTDLHLAEAEQVFRALSQCKACQTLERILIALYDEGDEWDGDEVEERPSTVIKQFLHFTQLQTLRVVVDCAIYLDNDLLLEAMSSWPHIRELELVDPHIHPSTITFRGLIAALRLCPQLHTLQVSIDAENIDVDVKAESFQHTSLQILDMNSSPVADAEAVARIICSIFPCIEKVGEQYSALPQVWHEINMHMESFRSSAVLTAGTASER